MEGIELLPCPFCGCRAYMRYIKFLERPWLIECENKRCVAGDTGVTFSTEEEAAEAWNRRTGQEGEAECRAAVEKQKAKKPVCVCETFGDGDEYKCS